MILTIVCDVLGEENNGTTIAAMNLIRSMRAKGHTVRVVCPDASRRGEKDFYVVPKLNLGPLNAYLKKNRVEAAKPDKRVIAEALDGADAVHLLLPFPVSISALKIARRKGLPVTASFHCQAENFTNHIFLMNAGLANKLVYRFFYRHVYRYTDCVHYPTEFIKDTFEKGCGHSVPGRVISNGVNRVFIPGKAEKPEEFKDKYVILFTGRYSKEKSHKLLIKAAGLSRYRDRIQLIFAGCGPQEKKLKKLSSGLPNPPAFRFFSRAEMVNVLHYADLYVHPAEIELEAIACLEAISCGLVPVINDSPRSATRYFAQSEKNLFKFNDPKDLAEKIDWWIEHPGEKALCSQSYRGYSARFNFDHCMDEMERMIIETKEAVDEAR